MRETTLCETTWIRVFGQSGAILLLAAILGLSFNQLRSERLPLVADWSPEAQLTLESGDTMAISLDQAEELFLARLAVFLDARSPELFAEGHIQGAINLPSDDIENRFAELLADVPPETPVIAYCDGESCNLSKDLALALLGKGYTKVRVLVNGWTLWQEKHLPVETTGGDLSRQ